MLGTRVTRILTEGRRVRGVVLESGRPIEASVVISNVDARETFGKLLGGDELPARYRRRIRRMEISPSVVAMYAATDLDVGALGACHDTLLFTEWDDDPDPAEATITGAEPSGLSILIPTLKDPSLAPPGEHLVIMKTFAPAEGDASRGDSHLADTMLDLAERVLPGLRDHLTFVHEEPSGSLHPLGPIYGWAMTPDQAGVRRLPQQTPVAGLFLSGHWTRPGHGIWTVVRSGVGAARLVLGSSVSSPALPLRL